MNWIDPRDEIIPKSANFKNFGHSDKISKQIRYQVISKNNYTCRFCGGIYPKYLISIKIIIKSKEEIDVCCRACYIIMHLNYVTFREIKLYHSEMPQLEIIRRTIDFIIINNKIPSPIDIDKNIKISPISSIEFINILNNYDFCPKQLKNYKFFFNRKFDIEFIMANYGYNSSMFIDENDNSINNSLDTDTMKFDETLDEHIPDKNEKNIFDKYFINNNLENKMDITIKIATNIMQDIKINS